jgi:hypothetical protein
VRGLGNDDDRLERDLRSLGGRASDEFVDSLAARLRDSSAQRGFRWSSLAFAAALATLTIGGFVSFGGAGYAASSAADAIDSLVRVSHPAAHHHVVKHTTSAADQYKAPTAPTVAVTPKVKAAKATKKPPSLASTAPGGQTLPFTGFSLATTVAVALLLIAVGLLLRRKERRRE